MYVVMERTCTREDVDRILHVLPTMQAVGRVAAGPPPIVVEVLESGPELDCDRLRNLSGVRSVSSSYSCVYSTLREADRDADPARRVVPLGSRAEVGGLALAVIAGPCSVEDEARLLDTAEAVVDAGAVGLRGGAFKPRTAPYSFQGLGRAALDMLDRVRSRTGLAIVTEVMAVEQIDAVAAVADLLQVGSRNMHNTPLLQAVGQQTKPILLKRGWSATLEEFLMAAEYIRRAGNPNVILCERGIRTFEKYVRNTLALAAVPEVQRLSGLPVIVDPSHGTGQAHLVTPMSRAAVACGADGLLIEVHPTPPRAWSDGAQSLDLAGFRRLMAGLRPLASVCGRETPAGQPMKNVDTARLME